MEDRKIEEYSVINDITTGPIKVKREKSVFVSRTGGKVFAGVGSRNATAIEISQEDINSWINQGLVVRVRRG